MSVTQFQKSFINLYSFPIELKPRIAKIQIYKSVKITKTISSLSEDITFVIFIFYLLEKSLHFITKHIRIRCMTLLIVSYLFLLLPVAIVAKCEEKMFMAQKNIVWQKPVAKTNSPPKKSAS